VLERAGKAWRDANAQSWRDYHERVKAHSRRRAELLRQGEAERPLAAQIELASLTQEIDGPAQALEHWRRLRSQVPEDPRVTLHYGRALAALRSGDAFDLLDSLASREPCYAPSALEVMKELAIALGDKARADRYDTRHRAALQRREAAVALFDASYQNAEYDPHRLPEHALAILGSQLQTDGTIVEACVVALRPESATPFRACLLVIRIDPEAMGKLGTHQGEIAARCAALLESVVEPGEIPVVRNFFTTELMDERVGAALAAIPSGRLFARAPSATGT
jgi:hypothetical protein